MKQTPMVLTGVAALLVIGTIGVFFRPVCVPLGKDNLVSFYSPTKERMTQRDWYLHVWREKGGQWMECRTYLTRVLRSSSP